MLKKSLIFGSVALLLTALIALTGCSQATEGNTTVLKENYLYGTGVSAKSAQAAIDNAIRNGQEVIFADGLEFADDDTTVDLKTAKVRVEGTVTLKGQNDGLVLNGAHADVQYRDGGVILVGAKAYFIYNGTGEEVTSIGGTRVEYTRDPMIVMGTADHIAVDTYTIGTSFGNIKEEVKTLFVLDTLTVTKDSVTPDRMFVPLGKVDVTGNNSAVFTGPVWFGPGSTLINSAGDVTIGLPGTALLRNIAPTGTITFTGGGTSLKIKETVQGPGSVVLGAAPLTALEINAIGEGAVVTVPAVSGSAGITDNKGSVMFSSATIPAAGVGVGVNTGTVTFVPAFSAVVSPIIKTDQNDGEILFAQSVTLGAAFNGIEGGKGKVVFNGTFNASTFAVELGTDVDFLSGYTRATATTAATTFKGNVNLAQGKHLDFGTPTGTPPTVTLAKGKVISVSGTLNGASVTTPVLAAGEDEDLVLDPVASAPFSLKTLPAVSDGDAAEEEIKVKTLSITFSPETTSGLTSGTLRVLPGAILEIPGAGTLSVGGTGELPSLVLEDGAGIQFAFLVSTGSLDIGNTVITNDGAAGALTAQGTVAFGLNAITGKAGSILRLHDAAGEVPAVITVGDSGTTAGTLTLKAVELDLQTAGSLVIGKGTTGPAQSAVVLALGAAPGKITFIAGQGTPLPAAALTDDMGIGLADNLNDKPGNGIIVTTTGAIDGELISVSGGLKSTFTILGDVNAGSDLTLAADTGIAE